MRILLLFLLLLPLYLFSQKTEKRIALVIGNAEYTKGALKNPVNDAKLIAKTLDSLGFEILEYYNLKRSFVFPEREFDKIISNYDDNKFFPNEIFNKETKQYEGGYYPERDDYLTDKNGSLIKNDNGDPIKDPSSSQEFLQKNVPIIKDKIKNVINSIFNFLNVIFFLLSFKCNFSFYIF